MKRHRRAIQYLILTAVLIIGGLAIGRSFYHPSAVLKPGSDAPAFKLLGLDGQAHALSDYRGKPLVLNFWGTFCPPCRQEMPTLQKEYEKWQGQGVQFVGLNLSEDRISVQNFVDGYGVDFPILLDRNREIERLYGLREYPTTYFIKPNGQIEDIIVGGPMTAQDIESRVQRLLQP